MGEKQTKPFQLSFNGSLKVDFQGSHVTSDGGLILVRELDERLGLGELIDEHLSDSRQGTNKQFTFADLLRQSVYSRLAGYEDLNDAERVSADPTFRLIGSKKLWDRGAALTSRLHSFETELLASEENLLGLMAEAVAPFCLRVAFATGQVVTSLMLLLLGCATNLSADPPAEATPQRPLFASDNSTTAPGTVEVELGGAGNGEFFGLPTLFKFTPDAPQGVMSGMEFSVGFDSISRVDMGSDRDTRFGDRIGFAIRRALYESGGFSFGVAPQAVFFLRDEEGARLGASAIAVYSFGPNNLVANLVWSVATDASENNPSRQSSVIAGYSRTLGSGPRSSRAAAFAEYLQEFPTGQPSQVSLIQGISYRLRPDLVLDFSLQQNGLAATPFDLIFATGLTYNLGRLF